MVERHPENGGAAHRERPDEEQSRHVDEGEGRQSERERACIAPDDDDVRQPRAVNEEDRRDRRGLNTP
ncbi:MAG: hypothetical protein M3Y58_02470 [Chloroflexota bacterium]|nr:hypothetical protein [Chloroflexota bacterium]